MRSFLTLMAFAGFSAMSAWAEPAYNADDIIKNFAPARADLGQTRGLCIGTEDDCPSGQPAEAVAPPPTFNLLVTFGLDAADLTEEAEENLDQFAIALKDPLLATGTFQVEGHTDGRGGDDYNLTLSERRAAAVVEYLRSKGVDTSKILVKGYGKARPRNPDPLAAENRRVEARLVQ